MRKPHSWPISHFFLVPLLTAVIVSSAAGCASPSQSRARTSATAPGLSPSATLPALRVGDAAPDFALDTLDGTREVHLSDFRDQTVLLVFWAVTCSPCVSEQAVVQRFAEQQRTASKPVVVVAVDLDAVTAFVKVVAVQQRLHLTYLLLVDDHYQARQSYQVSNLPLAYVLDRQHTIRSRIAGPLTEAILQNETGVGMAGTPFTRSGIIKITYVRQNTFHLVPA